MTDDLNKDGGEYTTSTTEYLQVEDIIAPVEGNETGIAPLGNYVLFKSIIYDNLNRIVDNDFTKPENRSRLTSVTTVIDTGPNVKWVNPGSVIILRVANGIVNVEPIGVEGNLRAIKLLQKFYKAIPNEDYGIMYKRGEKVFVVEYGMVSENEILGVDVDKEDTFKPEDNYLEHREKFKKFIR